MQPFTALLKHIASTVTPLIQHTCKKSIWSYVKQKNSMTLHKLKYFFFRQHSIKPLQLISASRPWRGARAAGTEDCNLQPAWTEEHWPTFGSYATSGKWFLVKSPKLLLLHTLQYSAVPSLSVHSTCTQYTCPLAMPSLPRPPNHSVENCLSLRGVLSSKTSKNILCRLQAARKDTFIALGEGGR